MLLSKKQLTTLAHLTKRPLVAGALILTSANILSRIIGFLFRIFLSDSIGAEEFGLYQLFLPIIFLGHSICTSGFEVALTKGIAACQTSPSHNQKNCRKRFFIATFYAVSLSLILSVCLYLNRYYISARFLTDIRCASCFIWLIPILPLSAIHDCICGYFLGFRNAKPLAISQLFEQIARVLSIFALFYLLRYLGLSVDFSVAVIGNFFGELCACIFCLALFHKHNPFESDSQKSPGASALFRYSIRKLIRSAESKSILYIAIPISFNHLLVSILSSICQILIPFCLGAYGLSASEALSQYGLMVGLVLPLLLFPETFIQSIAQMLIPSFARISGPNQQHSVRNTARLSFRFSVFFGCMFTILFCVFHQPIAIFLHNKEAGQYILKLALLCPMIYASTSLSGILTGLGYSSKILLYNVLTSIIRILLTVYLVPRIGMDGYIVTLLLSSFVNLLLHAKATCFCR